MNTEMNKVRSAKIHITIAALLLVFSICALISLNRSRAWFGNNDTVSASNMSTSVNAPETLVEKVEFFALTSLSISVDQNNVPHNNYHFSATPIEDESEIMLQQFSALQAERQLLIIITLKGDVTRVKISASSDADSFIIEDSSTVINKDGNSLSSAVQFLVTSDVETEELLDDEGNGTGEYEYVIDGTAISTAPARFTTLTFDDDGEVSGASFEKNIDVYTTPEGEGDNTVFILVDYYEEAAEYIISHVNSLIISGDTDVNSGEDVYFISDFKITVSHAQ